MIYLKSARRNRGFDPSILLESYYSVLELFTISKTGKRWPLQLITAIRQTLRSGTSKLLPCGYASGASSRMVIAIYGDR